MDKESKATESPAGDAVEALICFAIMMWRAGNTANRTREWMEVIAAKLNFDAVAVNLSLDTISASVRRSGVWNTVMRVTGPPGINAWRIGELEKLARAVGPTTTPPEIAAKLAEIDSAPPLYSGTQIAVAVGLTSGSFAFLNGAGVPEMTAAAIGGACGQCLRWSLSRRHLNQYGSAAVSAITASGVYVLVTALARSLGLRFSHHPVGFIASVLFLVPGFPLTAALFDLIQYQTIAAMSRLAYGVMILLTTAFGVSLVVAIAGVDLSRPPPVALDYEVKLLLRAAASFIAACGFAISFNSTSRTVLAAGFLAIAANSVRLVLIDAGLTLAPAAFLAAASIGVVALLADRRANIPRMAMAVAPIVIMIPGVQAFEAIVLFSQGQVLQALQAAALCGFVIGALAMGLATARFFIPR